MTTQVPDYVSQTDMVTALIRELLITGELGPGSSCASATWPTGSASAASARTYRHIMGADPVKEVSG